MPTTRGSRASCASCFSKSGRADLQVGHQEAEQRLALRAPEDVQVVLEAIAGLDDAHAHHAQRPGQRLVLRGQHVPVQLLLRRLGPGHAAGPGHLIDVDVRVDNLRARPLVRRRLDRGADSRHATEQQQGCRSSPRILSQNSTRTPSEGSTRRKPSSWMGPPPSRYRSTTWLGQGAVHQLDVQVDGGAVEQEAAVQAQVQLVERGQAAELDRRRCRRCAPGGRCAGGSGRPACSAASGSPPPGSARAADPSRRRTPRRPRTRAAPWTACTTASRAAVRAAGGAAAVPARRTAPRG